LSVIVHGQVLASLF